MNATRQLASTVGPYNRSVPYRRIHVALRDVRPQRTAGMCILPSGRLRTVHGIQRESSPALTPSLTPNLASATRHFSSPTAGRAKQRKPDDVDDASQKSDNTAYSKNSHSEKTSSEDSQQSEANEGEPASEHSRKEKKTDAPPPPPPHGDKTPWQVFTETLRSEFKASKEWNESTKALSSSAHQFTENESVKRARAAYAAGTSTTSSALKNTGKVLGQGAAWTWETPVLRGVRAGVNATGKGLDKVTKPVRETAAFKTVKEVIDDGSSSRYGGWVEKEERRKKRELREHEEARMSGRPGKRVEKIEEDPKYFSSSNSGQLVLTRG